MATGLLAILVCCALIQCVLAGRPLELVKRMVFDTPAAVAGILLAASCTQVGVDLVDAMPDGVWAATRPNAVEAVDGLALTTLPNPGVVPLRHQLTPPGGHVDVMALCGAQRSRLALRSVAHGVWIATGH